MMSRGHSDMPTPRSGLAGLVDRLAGPTATSAELTLQFGAAFAAAAAAGSWYALTADGRWWMVAIAVHILHLAVIAFVVLPASRHYFLVASGMLLTGATIILLAPRPLTRPVALTLFAVVIVVHRGMLPVPSGFEWFTPLFFLKLFVGHLVPEAESG